MLHRIVARVILCLDLNVLRILQSSPQFPKGLRWASTEEVLAEAPHSREEHAAYFNMLGWDGAVKGPDGVERTIRLSDGWVICIFCLSCLIVYLSDCHGVDLFLSFTRCARYI